MAILGTQIVITLIVATFMSRIGPFVSIARFLLTSSGLVRYMHPGDEELRDFALVPLKDRAKKSKRRPENGDKSGGADSQIFHVPKSSHIQLETTKVTVVDVVQLRFYSEYQWLMDFTLYGLLVYFLTEVYIFYFPARALNEVNLSMVWCVLAVGFAYKILMLLTGLYFEGEEAGERSLVICMGFAYLFLAMLVLILPEDTLETGLDEAYASFNASAAAFLADNAGLDSSGPASKLVLKFFIALWCASIGAIFTFPGLRMARMQWDVLNYTNSNFATLLLHATFVSPLILTTLWVKPLSRDYLTRRIYKGMAQPLLTSDQFETLRLLLVVFVVLFRLAMMPRYLQSYLNMAYHKMEELKQEAGKISNVDLQKLIARVFYYLCVVTLQYVAPMTMILFCCLMYKTMGGGSWTGLFGEPLQSPNAPAQPEEQAVRLEILGQEESVRAISGQFSLAWQSLKHVFTSQVFRGLLGFSTWWCCLASFTSAAIGISYQSYFANV